MEGQSWWWLHWIGLDIPSTTLRDHVICWIGWWWSSSYDGWPQTTIILLSSPVIDSWRWMLEANSYTIARILSESVRQQFSLQGVRRSGDGHLCSDGGDTFVRIIASIKLGQRERHEFFKLFILSLKVAMDPTLPSPMRNWSLARVVGY